MSNVKQICNALLIYTQDWDDRLPPADRWERAIPTDKSPYLLLCPSSRRDVAHSYVLNARLAGKPTGDFTHPELLPMIYESSLNVPNPCDRGASFILAHEGVGVVGYLDGHVRSEKQFPRSIEPRSTATAGLK